jgi:hypothetical protein
MKVTDLNPDAKWARATSVIATENQSPGINPWTLHTGTTGTSYLYDTGYQCMSGTFGGRTVYGPCYWNKPNPDDTKILLT